MGLDRSEHEPDEYDPEEEFRDPDSDSLTIPQVSTENAGSDLRSDLKAEFEEDAVETPEVSTADVDGETLKNFWALVLVINVAVLAYALGLLFLIFEGATAYASYLLAAGLVLTGFAIARYRSFQREVESDPDTDGQGSDSANSSSPDDERTDETTASDRSSSQPTATDGEQADETTGSDTERK
ncbi:DUF7322 domain-containing protein [Natronorubrum sp. FCH18a]|uniref:DUF7322 domain-containing protein n=1 Tax=Natronorubrum sp. FCH18a TaxID=3447018 RepID=UPI003F50D6ED